MKSSIILVAGMLVGFLTAWVWITTPIPENLRSVRQVQKSFEKNYQPTNAAPEYIQEDLPPSSESTDEKKMSWIRLFKDDYSGLSPEFSDLFKLTYAQHNRLEEILAQTILSINDKEVEKMKIASESLGWVKFEISQFEAEGDKIREGMYQTMKVHLPAPLVEIIALNEAKWLTYATSGFGKLRREIRIDAMYPDEWGNRWFMTEEFFGPIPQGTAGATSNLEQSAGTTIQDNELAGAKSHH